MVTKLTLSKVVAKIPTEAASSYSNQAVQPKEEIQDDFLISTSILENKSFWRQLIEEILQQDDKGMEPQDMKLSPKGNYVIQQLDLH